MSSYKLASQFSAGFNRLGYTSTGIKSGTAAARQKSTSAKSPGGRNMSSNKQPESQVRSGANKLGYGKEGIKPGTAAADHMSSTAKSHGGGVPAGSTVSDMQKAGSNGSGGSGNKK